MTIYTKLKSEFDLSFDPDELHKRYDAERDKRIRSDDEDQFIRVTAEEHGRFLTDDPYTPTAAREPRNESIDFLMVGGGWVGLITAARLIERGRHDIRIIEAGADFGGTWYWNRYPGAQCDVQSYCYLPLLEETGYVPKERYSYAPEIYAHAQRIGKHYGLYDKAVFQTWVTEMRWDDDDEVWIVGTNRGDRFRAKHVSIGTGPASRPRLPGVRGIDEFQGHSFHTCRWDYDYTGGGPEGGLTKLADKRVAVIGTGATAIQCVSHLAKHAKELFVFQRTPSSVSPRDNAPTDPEWAASLGPGWQQDLMRDFQRVAAGEPPLSEVTRHESILRLMFEVQELVAAVDPTELAHGGFEELVQVADFKTMDEIRARVDETVSDPARADQLKAWYNFLCKRPTFNDDYLAAFNRPNVTLVDVSDTKGVDQITAKGIVANGFEYEVDCIVYASGFEITSDYEKRIGIPIFGRGGTSIYDHWRDGMRTLLSLMVHGFPNLYLVGGLFGFTLGLNYSAAIEDQVRCVAHILDSLDRRSAKTAEPTHEGEEEWLAEQLDESPGDRPVFVGGASNSCTPGYYNHEGRDADKRRDPRREAYVKGGLEYARRLDEWQARGELDGLEIR